MLQAERALCAGPALRRSVAWSEMQCGCTHMHGSEGATQAEVGDFLEAMFLRIMEALKSFM